MEVVYHAAICVENVYGDITAAAAKLRSAFGLSHPLKFSAGNSLEPSIGEDKYAFPTRSIPHRFRRVDASRLLG
jgi:hypothetical protein